MLSAEQKFEIQELRDLGETVAPCENEGEVRCLDADLDKWEKCDSWVIRPGGGFGYLWFADKECVQTWLARLSEEVPEALSKLVICFYNNDDAVQILFRKSGLDDVPELLACRNPDELLAGEMDFKVLSPGRLFPWWDILLGEEQREPASWVSLDVDIEGDYNTESLHRLTELTDDEYELMLSAAREQNEWDGIALANQWLIYADRLWVTPMKDKGCFEKEWPTVKNTLDTVVEKRYIRYDLGIVTHDDLVAIDIDNDGPKILPSFLEKIQAECPELCQKIYAEKSKSGGGHIIVKHKGTPRRIYPLAQRFGVKGRVDKHKTPEDPCALLTLIEVLALGHPVCVAPSKGYVAFDGFCQLHKLPYLTDEEWQYLEKIGRDFSQIPIEPPKVKPKTTIERVSLDVPEGAVLCDVREYWERCSFATFDNLLERAGWTRVTPITGHEDDQPDSEQIKYRRPGKIKGESGNLRRIDGVWKFYNFSTSVKDGEIKGSMYPTVRAKLEFRGSSSKCYAVLAEEMWQTRTLRNLSFMNCYLQK